jgi:hypothetical protein
VLLDEGALAAKVASLGAYETQLPALLADFGDFVAGRGLRRERFWREGSSGKRAAASTA